MQKEILVLPARIRQAPSRLLLCLAVACVSLPAVPRPAHAKGTAGDEAWILALRGQDERAAARARDLLALDPADPTAMLALVHALRRLGRTSEAHSFCSDLEEEAAGSGAPPLGLGQLHLLDRRPAPAESLLAVALDRFSAAKDPAGELAARILLSEAKGLLENEAEEEDLLKAAAADPARRDRPLLDAWIELRRGEGLLSTKRHGEAAEHLEEALRRAVALDLPLWEGTAHLDLSIIARWKMDLDSALAHRHAALHAYRRSGSRPEAARTLHYIGVIQILLGNLTQAMRDLREALAIAQEVGAKGEAAGCLGDLATLNNVLGNEEAALRQSEEALQTGGDQRPREWRSGIQSNMGTILVNQGRFDEALVRFREALATLQGVGNRRYEAAILENIGRCLCGMREEPEGIANLQQAAALARAWDTPLTLAHAHLDMGACRMRLGDLSSAEASFRAASEISARTGCFEVQASATVGRSRVARALGDLNGALRLGEEAMGIVEGIRARARGAERVQTDYFARTGPIYEEAVDILWEGRGDSSDSSAMRRAFEIAQRAKARSFLDLLTEADVDLRFRADPEFRKWERAILDGIAERLARRESSEAATDADSLLRWESEIDHLEEEMSLLEEDLRLADPRYAEIQYPQPCGVLEVQEEVLDRGELLLEYLLGDNASYAWAVSRDRFRCARLPPRAAIEERVRALLPLLADYNALGEEAAYLSAPAAEMARMLLGPFLPEVERAERVVIAPDGILHYLPFEVLPIGSIPRDAASFSAVPYLILSTDVSYAPSVSALARLRRAPRSTGVPRGVGALLIGDPRVPKGGHESILAQAAGGGAEPLPFAKREISRIADLLPRGRSRRILGTEATIARLRDANQDGPYCLVHIAAHGFLNEERPRYSGVLLAPDPQGRDDGFLTAGEVFGLELPCDQVVLSCCSSALGEEVTGEGLIGLTRAFLYAGARNVVAALWEVSGEATSAFMALHYRELLSDGPMGPTHALAEAKRHMIRGAPLELGGHRVSSAHPCFWAPFVLAGEGR